MARRKRSPRPAPVFAIHAEPPRAAEPRTSRRRSGLASPAAPFPGIRERTASYGQELPLITAGAQGDPEDPVRSRVADGAPFLDGAEGAKRCSTGSDDELPDPSDTIRMPVRGEWFEPLVVVIVGAKDDVNPMAVQDAPELRNGALAPMFSARAEARVVEVCQRAGGVMTV